MAVADLLSNQVLFFPRVKQHLKIKRFLGMNENAVRGRADRLSDIANKASGARLPSEPDHLC